MITERLRIVKASNIFLKKQKGYYLKDKSDLITDDDTLPYQQKNILKVNFEND